MCVRKRQSLIENWQYRKSRLGIVDTDRRNTDKISVLPIRVYKRYRDSSRLLRYCDFLICEICVICG